LNKFIEINFWIFYLWLVLINVKLHYLPAYSNKNIFWYLDSMLFEKIYSNLSYLMILISTVKSKCLHIIFIILIYASSPNVFNKFPSLPNNY